MHQNGIVKGLLVSLCVFAIVTVIGIGLIRGIDSASSRAESDLVYKAVRTAALTCYAVEGIYPPSLDYLQEHYGFVYDDSIYQISYSAFASNVFPDIVVMEGGDGFQ